MTTPLHLNLASGSLEVTDLRSVLGPLLPKLPHVLRLLAENHLRTAGQPDQLIDALEAWVHNRKCDFELIFRPNRLLMHDTTCTPALVDVAAMRDVIAEAGVDPETLSPSLPVQVSIDHSVAVDAFAVKDALRQNLQNEIERNEERYRFMKWASENMETVHVNAPGTGIMHTINLEQLATLLVLNDDGTAHPDMMLGTDSHTPMINGIGVLGWGIGGLEAESIMFGETVSIALPDIVGVKLTGKLSAGVLATDLALEITHRLRELGVTGSYVEFFGPGVKTLSADARAVIANMAPEYGASTGFFPADSQAVDYLKRTGRPENLTTKIEPALHAMGLWFDPHENPNFNRMITIELDSLKPTIAGPRRPQDSLLASAARKATEKTIQRNLPALTGNPLDIPDGAIGIAAITSCTNTSDPRLLIAAGLLASKARARGLMPPAWVKTSLAPGSPSAASYLERAGLLDDLEAIGFNIVGFGCTTCIGNSGALPEIVETALQDGKAVTAVLSGNRNFPGRVHPKLDLGFLASPPMVIAFALRGHIRSDIMSDPISNDQNGIPVYLTDLWPDEAEIEAAFARACRAEDVQDDFKKAASNPIWANLDVPKQARFPWDSKSRSLRPPKFVARDQGSRLGTYQARALIVLGDDITTDHISPAGWIDHKSSAGQWLVERGGDPENLNVYASYRGNWEVMLRGLFTNKSAKNHLAEDLPPATTPMPDHRILPLFEAAKELEASHQDTIILAGERYGMGSSRDWAAKGAALLNVRAVIARSFERIHRTNLIGMGVLPVVIEGDFIPSEQSITIHDRFEIDMPDDLLAPGYKPTVRLLRGNGTTENILCKVAVATWQEVGTLRAGGVLPKILHQTIASLDE
ncbi:MULTISPECIES: aconitate hydratase AcnA [unclassified Thalassospira]|uniref:aconitate hydratase AcnA n=1 Tax=unclassified Thalassospira TaxID=2648997 RepID=UPI001B1BBEBA|nr:aconitate hydratase AcnA [Thalassospira sp.]MBO6773558.1 aconitate hydratase AcnA [Thalassospira sp.]